MRQWSVIRNVLILLAALAVAGCGGGSSTNKTVAQVILSPTSLSMVAGEVVTVNSSAVNATGGAVSPLPNITISTSNPKLVTVSPRQEVCGGVWDSAFIVCNGLDATGNPLTGTAILTATANGVSSGPVTVAVHPPVTSIKIEPDPVPGCFSNKETLQFKGHACSTAVTPHDATGPCSPNATEITDKVGAILWTPTNAAIVSVDSNGLATANVPGLAGVVATVGTTASPATNFKTCMPTQIVLHVTGDPPGQPTEAVIMNPTDTKIIQADMVDEKGALTLGAPVTIFGTSPLVASFSGTSSSTTITASAAGAAGFIAACAPPTCGAGINQEVYSNLFSVGVTGSSTASNVYVGSTLSNQLIPFDTSKTPITAGTAIQLPGNLFSIVFTADGNKAFLATDGGLASMDTSANTVNTLTTNAVGKILAISPDGSTVIMSNATFEPDPTHHRIFVFDGNNSTLTTFILPGAVSAAFTRDGSKAFIAAGSSPPNPKPENIYVYSPVLTLQKVAQGGTAVSVATLASGPFAFIANTTSGLQVINVCNNTSAGTAATNTTPVLLGSYQDADVIVALDSTGVNLEAVKVGLPASGFCPTTQTSTPQFIDFGIGALTAHRLLVATSLNSHVVVLPVGLNRVLSAVSGQPPASIPLASGGLEALDGGLTLDGATLWVGVSASNTLDRINLNTNVDELQLPVTALKKGDGSQAPPDVIGVKPH